LDDKHAEIFCLALAPVELVPTFAQGNEAYT